MSLESQIAALVSAASNLTSQVAGKLADIDHKVDEATESVPSVLRALASVTYYIDANAGDDSHPGTEDAPLKTISALSDKISNGSFVRLYLRAGQTHEVIGAGPSMSTGLFDIRLWGAGDWPTIKWSPESASSAGAAFGLRTGAFVVDRCNFLVQYTGAEPLRSTSGFLEYQPGLVSVFLYRANITLENAPFCTTSIAYCQRDLSLRDVDITIAANTNGRAKISYNAGPSPGVLRFEGANISLPANTTLRDLIDFSTNENALLSNMVI